MLMHRIKKLYALLPPLLARDLRERYAGSAFGIFWTFLQPILFILLYWLVFSQVLKIRIRVDTGDIPFLPFLLSGILPWFAIQDGLIRGTSSLLEKRHVIKKVMFPAELFPLSSVMSAFIHHSIGLVLFLIVFFIWKGAISVTQVAFIAVLLGIQILIVSGLSLFLSSLSVYVRDVIQVLGVALQVVFYTSTILYPLNAVPGKLKYIVLLNPMTALAEAYHHAILYDSFPDYKSFLYLIVVMVVAVTAGIFVFRKLKKGFADVL